MDKLLHNAIRNELDDTVVSFVDKSKGTDQNVFIITTQRHGKCVLKNPKKPVETRSPMHSPLHQAAVIRKLHTLGLAVPDVIGATSEYLIETFIAEHDWSEKDKVMTTAQKKHMLQQLGKLLKVMHTIKTTGFSYMSNEIFFGKYQEEGGWHRMWQEEFFEYSQALRKKNLITDQEENELQQLFLNVEGYLRNFTDSRLLHGDITPNNVMLTEDFQVGLIDYADCLCGDPLMDIARLLVELFGDWELLQCFLEGYEMILTTEQIQIVRFYAVSMELWFSLGDNNENMELLWKLARTTWQ